MPAAKTQTKTTFINREEELAHLNSLYGDGEFSLSIIYGKRRVGKTRLIEEYLKDKKGVYFLADKRHVNLQFPELLSYIGQELNNPLISNYQAKDWYDIFKLLESQVKEEFVLIIDEYSYLTMTDKATSSIFQKGIDQYLKNTPITLILSGSLITIMYEETIAYNAPLYGRNSSSRLIKPFTFKSVQKFFHNLNFSKTLEFYSVLGGMPHYCQQFDKQKSALENIEQVLLNKQHKMFNEVENVTRESFRDSTTYYNILRSIASGITTHSKIANSIQTPANQLDSYLDKLLNLQLIEKVIPLTDNPEKSKKGIYKLCDNFYTFWFRYVLPNKSPLEIGRKLSLMTKIEAELPTNLGHTYETVCRELIWQVVEQTNKLFDIEKLGSWWETVHNTLEKRSTEEQIDIVALNESQNQILFGECKWTNKILGMEVWEDLARKSKLVNWKNGNRQEYFILFSKSGFSTSLTELAKEKDNLVLVEMDKIIS
jgi:uncharacterized protein